MTEKLELAIPSLDASIDPDDIDGLIDAFEQVQAINSRVYAAQQALRRAIASHADADSKTRRVQGKRRRAKVIMPDESINQSKLKEAWNAYPQYRDQVLRIASVGLKKREWKKFANTSGDVSLEQFRDMVAGAIEEPRGVPRVEIEPDVVQSVEPEAEAAKEIEDSGLF